MTKTVLVCEAQVPFVPGGAEGLVAHTGPRVRLIVAGEGPPRATDAGGPREFDEDGVTGLVCDPTPEARGAAIARLADAPRTAQSLGDAGYERAGDHVGGGCGSTHG